MRLATGDDATAATTAVVCRLASRRRSEMRRHGVDETLGCGVDGIVVVLHQLAQRPGSLGRRTALPQSKCRPRCVGDGRHSAITKSAEREYFTILFTIN